jgi:hypothetical protein
MRPREAQAVNALRRRGNGNAPVASCVLPHSARAERLLAALARDRGEYMGQRTLPWFSCAVMAA